MIASFHALFSVLFTIVIHLTVVNLIDNVSFEVLFLIS